MFTKIKDVKINIQLEELVEENGTSLRLAQDKVQRTTDTFITSTSLTSGSTYTYKVRAFKISNDTKVYTDFFNEEVIVLLLFDIMSCFMEIM